MIFGRNTALVYPPSDWLPQQEKLKPLGCRLRREYVYGYNGACKSGIHLISEKECVYPVAALVIVLNFLQNTQRFFEGHTNDVTCVAWNEKRRICASGQQDPKGARGPVVCIWAPHNCAQTISILAHPEGSRWVSAVGFSPDGQTAVSFTGDDAYTFYIWRDFAKWDGTMHPPKRDRDAPVDQVAPKFSISSGRQPTSSIFMYLGTDTPNTLMFYTVGDAPQGMARGALGGTFSSWLITLQDGADPAVVQKRGIFGKCAVPRNPTYVAHAPERGTAWMVADNGHFYVVSGSKATRNLRVVPPRVETALGCIATLPDGRWLAGGTDGALYLGRADPVPRLEERLTFGEQLGGEEGHLFRTTAVPRFSSIMVRDDLVLLGTSNHALILVDIRRREVLKVLQVSHADEAWAMDFHPSVAVLATASCARDVRFWNVAERRPAIGKILRAELRVWSLAFGVPDGALLVLGCDQGVVEAFAFPSLHPIYREGVSKTNERIADLRFSPDGALLAAACFDQVVYLFRVATAADGLPTLALHRALIGNSSSPMHVMFSANGEYVMSNSRDTQILYWRTKDGARETTSSAFRDTRWQTPWTCTIGWPVIGIWGDSDYDSTDVKSLCQSQPPEDGYLAHGDDQGRVKLFRFPSPFLDPPYQVCPGHAAIVTRVRFSRTNVLASLGGDDHSIAQWALERIGREAEVPVRVVHPWADLGAEDADRAGDRFAFLGRPAAVGAPSTGLDAHGAGPKPTSYEAPLQDPWAALATAARAPQQVQQPLADAPRAPLRAASAGATGRGHRGEEPPAAGATGELGPRRRGMAHGARGWESNQSRGVGEALVWAG